MSMPILVRLRRRRRANQVLLGVPFDDELRSKTQETLIAFLRAELDLGSTLVQSALIAAAEDHSDHYEQAKGNATAAADTIRRFIGQVEDQQAKAEIDQRLSELDRLFSKLTF